MNRTFHIVMTALPVVAVALAVALIATAGPGVDTTVIDATGIDATGSPLPVASELRKPVGDTGVDSLDICVDGKLIHLLVGTNSDDLQSATFRHTRSVDGGATWSEAVIVSAGGSQPVSHHRGADARIIARGDKLFAAWTTPGSGFKGTGPMGTALSSDGGKTWKPGPNPADHESTGSHRFLALTASEDAFHLAWLDDRDKLRGLRHASSTDGGAAWSANTTIDEFTCACCWNTLLYLPADKREHDGPATLFALYRDMKPSDMGLARSHDAGKTWKRLGHVGAFDWDFDGCPHVGGAMAALSPAASTKENSRLLFAVVWSGHEASAGCHLLRGEESGEMFLPLRRIGGPTAKMADIVADDRSGTLAVAWDEVADDDRCVFVITSGDAGRTWSQPKRLSSPGMQATHPRLVVKPTGGIAVMWTQTKGSAAGELISTDVAPHHRRTARSEN